MTNKYIIKSNWNGWDNTKNLKDTEQELSDEQVQHLENAGVKLQKVENTDTNMITEKKKDAKEPKVN